MLSKDIWDLLVEEAYQGIKEQSEMIVEDSSESFSKRGLPSGQGGLHPPAFYKRKVPYSVWDE